MIVPVVDEAEWLSLLDPLPVWELPRGPILIVAPHPDDESLATGGLIAAQRARGVDVTVVAVTDGENAYADYPELAAVRRREQTEGLRRLGVEPDRIVRLGVTDSDVASYADQLVEQLSALAGECTHVVAPWRGDFHPDHEACGRAAERVCERTGATLVSCFFWTWHRGTPATVTGMPLRRFPLHPEWVAAKMAAVRCHRSQFEHESGEPILNERLLAPARRPFEVFLTP